MPADNQRTRDHLDLACAPPIDDETWCRQCEMERLAMHEVFRRRSMAGRSVAATIVGAIIEAGMTARVFFDPAQREHTLKILTETLEGAFNADA